MKKTHLRNEDTGITARSAFPFAGGDAGSSPASAKAIRLSWMGAGELFFGLQRAVPPQALLFPFPANALCRKEYYGKQEKEAEKGPGRHAGVAIILVD